MHTVEQAIIMAAGKGERMRPLTNTVPKPLIKVNGIRMIESVIQALKDNDISPIYIVVGYQKELFSYLEKKYEDLHLIENPYYEQANNISSLYVTRDHLENAIILDGDQIINNPSVLSKEFKTSGYNSVWKNEHTSEWLQTVENDKVISCSRNGGIKGWQLFSVSRWTKEDGKKLKKIVAKEFEAHPTSNLYWDDLALFKYSNDFELGIYEMNTGDVIEIDSFHELQEIDPSYVANKGEKND